MKSFVLPGCASSRRRFLSQTLAASAVAAARPQRILSADEAPSGDIDAHVHIWTPDTEKYPLAAGFKKHAMRPASFTPEQLFAHCRPCGVERIVLIQMSFYRYDNAYMLDMMGRHRGVFGGVAIVDPKQNPAEAMRRLASKGVRGFRIVQGQRTGRQWMESPGMAEMWRCGADRGLAMCHLCQPDSLSAIGQMCRKFPQTPVVIDHFARIGIDGVIRSRDVDRLCQLAGHKNVHVKVSAFYALGEKKAPYTDLQPMIRRVADAFGAQRLMWASDCPFQVVGDHNYRDSIELVRSRLDFLTDADKQWLLRKTAEKVFFS